MNEKQFSDRIGNVNDKLIRQAEQIPNYRRGHRRRSIRQLATIAAVIALMVCSFSVGALAFAEKIYVEKSQESIDITVILTMQKENCFSTMRLLTISGSYY